MNGEVVVKVLSSADASPGQGGRAAAEMGTVIEVNIKAFFLASPDASSSSQQSREDFKTGADASLVVPLSDQDIRAEKPFEELTSQRMMVGERDVVAALELALSHSHVGDKLQVRCTSKYAYGATGRPSASNISGSGAHISIAAIPAYANLEFEVTVAAFHNLHTAGLTPEELEDAGAVERNAVYQEILLRKEVGNRWYHYGDFANAARAYAKGAEKAETFANQGGLSMQDLLGPKEEAAAAAAPLPGNSGSSRVGEQERLRRSQLMEVYLTSWNNLAACHISQGEFARAQAACIKVRCLSWRRVKGVLPMHVCLGVQARRGGGFDPF